ncbi:uncharacterized protein LOC128278369 [Anopheles cruzii]|uniref:uncharacterized protein LOC128278369 n=1 Tax=Anopheles cruzii TaxID=68878 RepID=UPI0022EC73F6|nr:uncharacterized protein LOC128278369 [Anopheles cruzii]
MEPVESSLPVKTAKLQKRKINFDAADQGPDNVKASVANKTAPPKPPTNGKAQGTAKTKKLTYEQMISEVIAENDPKRKGLSFLMLQKTIRGKYVIDGDIKLYVKRAFEKLLAKHVVEHVTGSGASGSIRFTKDHWEKLKKSDKKVVVVKEKQQKTKDQPVAQAKDKNNNTKGAKKMVAPKAKVPTKKTAITKTKIDRASGKVRLSITTNPTSTVKNPIARAQPTIKAKSSEKAPRQGKHKKVKQNN